MTAQPFQTATGTKPSLTWSIRLPDNENPANYTHFIRQILHPSGLVFDTEVTLSGSMLSPVAVDPGSATFELWTVCSFPLKSMLLDATVSSSYLPTATVTIRSEDPYPYLPRTRADRPFQVDITVNGLSDDPFAPDVSKSVTLLRHAQSYGPDGIGDTIDRSQAKLFSQSTITTNGIQVLAISAHSIPGNDGSNARGEERFSILTVDDSDMPASVIDSRFIQIWPVAYTSIDGITDGQIIGPVVPSLTFHLNNLYPSSTTYAQIYKGSPKPDATGRIVPGTLFAINRATPQSRSTTVQDYLSIFDSDGVWTMEILTHTPFGTERMSVITFTVQGTASIREEWRMIHFGSRDNSGNGADTNDFDHDGLSNLVEFAFGLNPRVADRESMPVPQLSGDQLVTDFYQPSGVGGITYIAEWSQSLQPGTWTPLENSSLPPRHTFSLPRETHPAAFMRLKVTGQ